MSTSTSPTPGLPLEITLNIFRAVDTIYDLLNCKVVCKLFRSAIEGCSELQYRIELASSGMMVPERPPPNDLSDDSTSTILAPSEPLSNQSIAHRLQNLLALQTSWRDLAPRAQKLVSVPRDLTMYELQHGVLAIGTPASEGDSARSLTVMKLPSLKNASALVGERAEDNGAEKMDLENGPSGEGTVETELRTWHHADLGFESLDFTMDPTQDLIASLAWQDSTAQPPRDLGVHLRTLSKNTPHPAARHAYLTFANLRCFRRTSLTIQIYGDYLGMLAHYPSRVAPAGEGDTSMIKIWNWKTGEVCTRITSASEASIVTFVFLSDSTFSCVSIIDMQASIRIYTFQPAPPPAPTGATERPEAPAPFLAATLKLPTLAALSRVQVTCRSEPAPYIGEANRTQTQQQQPRSEAGSTSDSEEAQIPPEQQQDTPPLSRSHEPFLTSPASRLLVYTVSAQRFEANNFFHANLVFVVPASHLLSYATPHLPNPTANPIAPHLRAPKSPPMFNGKGEQINVEPSMIPLPSSPQMLTRSVPTSVILPWSAWGPYATRWFEDLILPHWVCYVHGTRVVGTKRRGDGFCIRLLDFNQYALRRWPGSGAEASPHLRARSDSKSSVGSSLPQLEDWERDEVDVSEEEAREVGSSGLHHHHSSFSSSAPSEGALTFSEFLATSASLTTTAPPPSTTTSSFSANTSTKSVRRVVTEPTIISQRNVFEDDIVSWLPYAETTGLDMPADDFMQIPGIMIDEERIMTTREMLGGNMDIEILNM